MAVITYAQNFEDVLLSRVFEDKHQGFYVDVGAAHPELLSVTKCFYDMGWHGINIEPNKKFHALLQERRPRDINLHMAAGSRFEIRDFFVSPIGKYSSFNRENACIPGAVKPNVFTAEVWTLAEICRQFCDAPVDFLKIDVEGAEREVLEGANFATFRPVVVIVESTKPNSGINWHTASTNRNSSEWEAILTGNGYDFVFHDGLNDFFVRHGNSELKEAFSLPINPYEFIFPGDWNLTEAEKQLLPPAHAEQYRCRQESIKIQDQSTIQLAVLREEIYRCSASAIGRLLWPLRGIKSHTAPVSAPATNVQPAFVSNSMSRHVSPWTSLSVQPIAVGSSAILVPDGCAMQLEFPRNSGVDSALMTFLRESNMTLVDQVECVLLGHGAESAGIWGETPWLGIARIPPTASDRPTEMIQREPRVVFSGTAWSRAASTCRGLIAFSSDHAAALAKAVNVPVTTILHPVAKAVSEWSPERFRQRKSPRLIQPGWWLRCLHAIYMFPGKEFEKVGLTTLGQTRLDALLAAEIAALGLEFRTPMLKTARFENVGLASAELDSWFGESVVFLHLHDASAEWVVLECLSRATPLLVNQLPAVREYLGREYPLYYTCYDEAAEKAADFDLLRRTHDYLRARRECSEFQVAAFEESLRHLAAGE